MDDEKNYTSIHIIGKITLSLQTHL